MKYFTPNAKFLVAQQVQLQQTEPISTVNSNTPAFELWGIGAMVLSALAVLLKEELALVTKRRNKILDQANAYIDVLKEENIDLKRQLENLRTKYDKCDEESDNLKVKVAQLEKILELSGPLSVPLSPVPPKTMSPL